VGLGLVEEHSEKVEFQVLQRKAVHRMRLVSLLSLPGFLISGLITVLAAGLGICGLAGVSGYCEYVKYH